MVIRKTSDDDSFFDWATALFDVAAARVGGLNLATPVLLVPL